MKNSVFIRRVALATTAWTALSLATPTFAQMRNFDMPAQPMRTAINQVAQQSGLQIVAAEEDVAQLQAKPLKGALDARAAVRQLIAGTELEIVADDGRTLTLARRSASGPFVDENTTVDELVVTGYQLQNRRSVAAKQESATISEFVTQDEAGQNPDYNIADALRRAPGVTAVFDEDEGRYVAVRGLNPDYSLVTLNGMQLASSDQTGRRVLIEQVPASAVSRMQVVKSLTPNYDGAAIGGLVDLQTRSAFDGPATFFTGQALIGHYDSRNVPGKDKLSVRGDMTFSKRFGADQQFGVVLSGSYMERTRDQERLIINGYSYYTPTGTALPDPRTATGEVVGLPNVTNYLNYTLTSKRFGGFAAFEYQPNDQLYAQLYYSQYTQDDDETRYAFVLTPGGAPVPSGSGQGLVPQARATVSTSQFVISKPVEVLQGRFSYDFGRGKLDVRASTSEARWDERGPGVSFVTPVSTSLAYRYDNRGTPTFSFVDPTFALNPANYTPTTVSSVNFNVLERVNDIQGDYRFDLGSGWTIQAGAKAKDVRRTVDRETPSWTSAGLTLADFDMATGGYVPPYSGLAVPVADRVAFWNFFAQNPGRFTYNTTAANLAGLVSDFTFEEQVMAGYLMAEHEGDRHRLIFGGRYEATDVDVARYIQQAGVATPTRDTTDYSHFLPSAVLTYDLTDQLKLRLAAGRSIGRPNQSDLAGGESRSDVGGVISISRPNPELKPRQADNFDLSLEYYFDGGDGLISAGVFHKNVKDEIFRGTQEVVEGGVTYRITQPQNLAGAKLTGIELNLVKNRLDFLPGELANFGVSANYTYIHTDAEIVMANGARRAVDQLLDQPQHLFNASLFYRRGPFESRLSYSRPGRSYQTLSTASPVEDVMYEPFNQLDLQLRYDVNDQLRLIAEGRNLLGESRDTVRPFYDEVREINQHGRGYWVGVSYRY